MATMVELLRSSFIKLQAGGPGSGCHGDNCGRPPGPGHTEDHSKEKQAFQDQYKKDLAKHQSTLKEHRDKVANEGRKSSLPEGFDGVKVKGAKVEISGVTVRNSQGDAADAVRFKVSIRDPLGAKSETRVYRVHKER